MEYGDLVHIIWDFQQLEAGTRDEATAALHDWFEEMIEQQETSSPMEDYLKKRALEYLVNVIDNNADDAVDYINNKTVNVSIAEQVGNATQKAKQHVLEATNTFDTPSDAYRLLYGFLNGAVDVFPYNSLPDLCRDNATATKTNIEELFITSKYVLPEENLEAVTAFSQVLTYPYGLSFSCLFGAKEVFTVKRKAEDTTGFTDAEILANEMMIVNDVITNFVFNLGYIYSDVSNYALLDAANLNYWRYTGEYAGDFLMRFWYR